MECNKLIKERKIVFIVGTKPLSHPGDPLSMLDVFLESRDDLPTLSRVRWFIRLQAIIHGNNYTHETVATPFPPYSFIPKARVLTDKVVSRYMSSEL